MPVSSKTSMRYELIAGAYRRYPDGREVCTSRERGREEYRYRIMQMVMRQSGKCRWCHQALMLHDATFDHEQGRGMGSSRRDDRIMDSNGREINAAIHARCNIEKGSRRGYETR